MNFRFSDESKFVIKNWETIQKLKIAEGEVIKDFPKYLMELKTILLKKNWFGKNIKFVMEDDEQAYISKNNWKVMEDYAIWIGIEGFNPDNFFGSIGNATCYLYVANDDKINIISDLKQLFEKDENYSEYISKGNYILEKSLKKYEPEEIENFIMGDPLEDIADFIEGVYLIMKDYKIS